MKTTIERNSKARPKLHQRGPIDGSSLRFAAGPSWPPPANRKISRTSKTKIRAQNRKQKNRKIPGEKTSCSTPPAHSSTAPNDRHRDWNSPSEMRVFAELATAPTASTRPIRPLEFFSASKRSTRALDPARSEARATFQPKNREFQTQRLHKTGSRRQDST